MKARFRVDPAHACRLAWGNNFIGKMSVTKVLKNRGQAPIINTVALSEELSVIEESGAQSYGEYGFLFGGDCGIRHSGDGMTNPCRPETDLASGK